MRNSVIRKIHKDIILEFIYNDNNIITDNISIFSDKRYNNLNLYGGELSGNNIENNVIQIETTSNKWVNVQDKSISSLLDYKVENSYRDLLHNEIIIRLPNNYNFDEYQGFVISISIINERGNGEIYLCNILFDKDINNFLEVTDNYIFEDRIWNKILRFNIPNLDAILDSDFNNILSISRLNNLQVNFHFITKKTSLGSRVTYMTNNPINVSIPRKPEMPELSVVISESSDGDYYEIYPMYDNSHELFNDFVLKQYRIGKLYNIEYIITPYESNIRGRKIRFIKDPHSESSIIRYRPIVKWSSDSFTMNIEMIFTDLISGNIITKRAVYGMLPNQISKYHIELKRNKVNNINKSKIYVKKNKYKSIVDDFDKNYEKLMNIEVDTPVLFNKPIFCNVQRGFRRNIHSTNYKSYGNAKINITPFDTKIKLRLATIENDAINFLDLSKNTNLFIVFTDLDDEIILPNQKSDLMSGELNFLISSNYYQSINNIYKNGYNQFYIISMNNNIETTLYHGTFKIINGRDKSINDNLTEDNIDIVNDTAPITIEVVPHDKEDAVVIKKYI